MYAMRKSTPEKPADNTFCRRHSVWEDTVDTNVVQIIFESDMEVSAKKIEQEIF